MSLFYYFDEYKTASTQATFSDENNILWCGVHELVAYTLVYDIYMYICIYIYIWSQYNTTSSIVLAETHVRPKATIDKNIIVI